MKRLAVFLVAALLYLASCAAQGQTSQPGWREGKGRGWSR